MKNRNSKVKAYIVSILIAVGVGVVSSFVSSGKMGEYEKLVQPPLAPPTWVFPVVWTILFVLMGISAAIIYRSSDAGKKDALFIYGTQLIVNFLWTVFYFNFNARLLAFFWLLFLLVLVIMMNRRFSDISSTAAKLQIPYLLWLIFAAYLNIATWYLNK